MRRAIFALALAAFAVALGGCAYIPPPPAAAPPPPPPPLPPAHNFVVFFDFDASNLSQSADTSTEVTRIFSPTTHARVRVLYSDAWGTLKAPQGFILLVRGQDSRNLIVCRSVVIAFGKPQSSGKPQRDEVPLYWPDRRRSSEVGTKSPFECADRLENFDYNRSDDAVTNLRRNSLIGGQVKGPVLIVYRDTKGIAYALDLSVLHDDELGGFLAKWHDDLLQNPAVWDGNRLKRELFRQKMRHLVHDASQVVSVLIPLAPTQAWAKEK